MAWFSRRKSRERANIAVSHREVESMQTTDDHGALTMKRKQRLADYIGNRNDYTPLIPDYVALIKKATSGSLRNVAFTDESQVGEYLITHLVFSGSPADRSNDAALIRLAKARLTDHRSLSVLKQSSRLEIDQQILEAALSQFARDRSLASPRIVSSAPVVTSDGSSSHEQPSERQASRTLDEVLTKSQKKDLFVEVRAPYRAQVSDAVIWASLTDVLTSMPAQGTHASNALLCDKERILHRASRIVDQARSAAPSTGQPGDFAGVEPQRTIDELITPEHRAVLLARVRESTSAPLDESTLMASLSRSLQSVNLNASTNSQNAIDRFGQKLVSKSVAHLKSAEAEYFAEQERQRQHQIIHERRLENRHGWEELSHLHPDGVGDICVNKDDATWEIARLSFVVGSGTKKLARAAALETAERREFSELGEATRASAVESALDEFFSTHVSPENLQAKRFIADLDRSMEASVTELLNERLIALTDEHRVAQKRLETERYIAMWRDYATQHPGRLGTIAGNLSLAFETPPMNRIAGRALIDEIRFEFQQEQSLASSAESQAFTWAIDEITNSTIEIGGRLPDDVISEVRNRTRDALPLTFRGHLNRANALRDARESRRLALVAQVASVLLQAVLQARNRSTSSMVWLHDDGWWEDLCRQYAGTLDIEELEGLSGGDEGRLTPRAQYVLERVAAEREVDLLPGKTTPDDETTAQISLPVPGFRSLETPRDFEELSREWMAWLGYSDSTLTSGGADGGIDVIAQDGVAQVKQYAAQVSSPEVQKFAGASMVYPNKDKLFFASTRFSSHAVDFANLPHVKIALFQVITDRGQQIEPYSLLAKELLDSRRTG